MEKTDLIHLGLILDGNRRWATSKGFPKLEGHRAGFDNLKAISEAAFERGVKYVTAFIFSTENWNRAKEEVDYLMSLADRMIAKHLKDSYEKGVRLVWVGSTEGVNEKLVKAIKNAEEKTKHHTKGTLALCFNYGGRRELVDTFKSMIRSGISEEDVNEEQISKHLYAPEIPPIDMMVRTSGEQRISNFMLWRIAYSEMMFVEKHWPAFTVDDLEMVLKEYESRNRRFGGG